MPRITRAALRSQEHQDEIAIAASTPLPQTPTKTRMPLGEIAGNKGTHSEAAIRPVEQAAPSKKGPGRGKKGNNAKKVEKHEREKAEEVCAEVLEDGSPSIHSPAAVEACQDLLNNGSQESIGINPVILDNDRPQTPPSAAANGASQELSSKSKTPELGSAMRSPDDKNEQQGNDGKEDSFIAKIESRTPLKTKISERAEVSLKEEGSNDDSFVEQTKARTPGKRISRIEDSVEALDALEEEIERVGELIPASAESLHSPVKSKKQPKSQPTDVGKRPGGTVKTKKSTGAQKKVRRPSTAVGTATSHPSIGPTKTRARSSTSLAEHSINISTQTAGSPRVSGQATSQAVFKPRLSSVHKAPFQPVKSMKPPTRPNFELPGEAVARKLKEQREERTKREEEETPKPRAFKARPVRLSHAPEVRLTTTTKARLSMAKGEPIGRSRPSNGFDASRSVALTGPMASISPNKRLSTLSVPKKSTQPIGNGPKQSSANSSARLTRGPSFTVPNATRAPSALGANRPAPTAEESAHLKLKGKEVFDRTKVEIMEREKSKKEKEDAARKARADAAERGRIASRAWAEKQKARKAEVGKVGDQGKVAAA